MIFQAEMLAQVLRLAQAKALELVQAAPPRLEAQAVLLQREVQAVLRQAVALQQLAALPQEQEVPQVVQQVREQALGWAAQQVLVEMAQSLAQAEEQVEVLAAEQVRELVQVPLLEEE